MSLLVSCMLAISIYALPINQTNAANVTQSLYSNHGDPDLVCTPSSRVSIVLFLFTNYLAHCATVVSYPGETWLASGLSNALALFFPASGIIRAMNVLIRRPRLFGENEVETATRAGALVMVVRTDNWQPPDKGCEIIDVEVRTHNPVPSLTSLDIKEPPNANADRKAALSAVPPINDEIETEKAMDTSVVVSEDVKGDSEWNFQQFKMFKPRWMREHLPQFGPWMPQNLKYLCSIHGVYRFPEHDYEFATVPSDAKVLVGPENGGSAKINVAYSYNFAKVALALLQTITAAATLYRARGNQITLYGYSAFGLTVTPYLIMSIVNLLAQMVMPEYPKLYMVRSPEMDEAERRGGYFDSVIGRLSPSKFPSPYTAKARKTEQTFQFSIQEDPKRRSPGSRDGQVELLEPDIVHIPFCSHFELEHSKVFNRRGEQLRTSLSFHRFQSGKEYEDITAQPERQRLKSFTAFFLGPILVVGVVSILIIALLTHFHPGQSTRAQRSWTLSWLAFGTFFGWLGPIITIESFRALEKGITDIWTIAMAIVYGLFFVPAIGGFVVVVQMLEAYGTCIRP